MVSGGTVTGDAGNLSNIMSQYTSGIDGVVGKWTGKSYDQFESMTSEFSTSFPETINSQLTDFASACDKYKEYETLRDEIKNLESQINSAKEGEDTSSLSSQKQEKVDKCEALRSEIANLLTSASGTKLEATVLSASVAASLGGATNSNTGSLFANGVADANLICTPDGYVFPFAKGIDAPVTSSVGPRDQPTAGASTNHHGTDIGVPEGTEVHSISSGVVTNAGRDDAGGYGNWVRVEHDNGTVAIYGHLSKSDYYNVGDRVNAGDVVALTGNEGVSTGPHLHLQVESSDGEVLNSENIFDGYWPV